MKVAQKLFDEALIITVHNTYDHSNEAAQIMLEMGKNFCDMKMYDESTKYIVESGRIMLTSEDQSLHSMQKDVHKWLKKIVKGKRKQESKKKK